MVVKDSVDSRITKMLANKHGDGESALADDDDDDCLVGCIKEDKTEILTEEFDLLFGFEAPPPPPPTDENQGTNQDEDRKPRVKTEGRGRVKREAMETARSVVADDSDATLSEDEDTGVL